MSETNFDYQKAIAIERDNEIAMRKSDIEGLKQQIATSNDPDAVRRCKELLIEAKFKLSQLENA